MKTERRGQGQKFKIISKAAQADETAARKSLIIFLFTSIILALLAWSSAANASGVHYVVDTDYRDVLVPDDSATRACTAMARINASMTQVVFTRSNKAFFWSDRTPDRFYTSLGWSDCQGWRRIEPANGRDDTAD